MSGLNGRCPLAGKGRYVDQLLGRTRKRDWAGRTGRAGSSLIGCRLASHFLIGMILLFRGGDCFSSMISRDGSATQGTGDKL
jgi:hypothetical protein